MAMTNKQRRKQYLSMIDCFQEAKKHLTKDFWEPGTTFICVAIMETQATRRTQRLAEQMVMQAIHPFSTFSAWMDEHNPGLNIPFEQMQDYRRQWIDQMCDTLREAANQLQTP